MNNFKDTVSCSCAHHKAVNDTGAEHGGHSSDNRIWRGQRRVLKIYILSFMLRIAAEHD